MGNLVLHTYIKHKRVI